MDTGKSRSGNQITALAVYTDDSLDRLAPVAHNSANTNGYTLAFSVAAGRTYQIAANGYDGSCTGQIGFNWRVHPSNPLLFRPAHPKPHLKPKRKVSG